MTRCGIEFERLSGFADGELDPRQELDLRRHMERCGECNSILDSLLGLKAAVAATAEVRPVPHSLRERVSEILAQEPPKLRVWSFLTPSILAAAFVLAVFVLRPFWSKPRAADRLTRAMIEDHIHYLAVANPLQVATDDPQQIAQAFADQFGFRLVVPVLPKADLLGGRLCWLHGHKALLTFYQTPAGRFSLFVLDKNAFTEPGAEGTKCTSNNSYEVCLVWRAPEVLAMVANHQQATLIMPALKKLGSSD